MSIEKITSRILGEAEAERDITLAEARARSEAVLAEAEKNAATLLADAERRGKIEKDKIITRRKSVADIDCRKVFLAKNRKSSRHASRAPSTKSQTCRRQRTSNCWFISARLRV